MALGGHAFNVLHSLSQSLEPSYRAWAEPLENRYGDNYSQQVYQAQLKSKSMDSETWYFSNMQIYLDEFLF